MGRLMGQTEERMEHCYERRLAPEQIDDNATVAKDLDLPFRIDGAQFANALVLLAAQLQK